MLDSASSIMRAIMLTASTGYFPVAVSAESITASEPSKIALATSEASARVGRGFSVLDSSIRAVFQRENQIGAVFWRERGHAQFHSRQVDSFVLAERPAVHDFANDIPAADFLYSQFDQPVRKQDAVATMNFSRQRRENRIYTR